MIYKKVGSADATREIYHEVYLSGLLKLHQLRDVEKFPGWIIANYPECDPFLLEIREKEAGLGGPNGSVRSFRRTGFVFPS